jgi:DnaK suppressor protein
MQSVKKIFTLDLNAATPITLMALQKEKVETYRRLLVTRRDALAEDLRIATAQLINDESVYTDAVDQAAAETDKNFTLQLKNRERNVLWQIDEAIKRLDGGSFGECERCEEAISEGRIEAFPFTTLCVECKAELESEEHRFPNRN